MAKLTRNSYKRKIIMFGAVTFASVALVSTGFAAWVLATQTTANQNGNVTVGAVSDKSFEISFTSVTDQYGVTLTESNYNFAFEPHKDDRYGRVFNNGTDFENMKLIITGKVTNYDYLGSFTVKMTVPTEISNAAAANYITLPQCVGTEVNLKTLSPSVMVKNDEDGSATFTYTIEFGWGDVFGGKNPGYYYDIDPTGSQVAGDTVKTTLNAFYNAAHAANSGYTITFTATAK